VYRHQTKEGVVLRRHIIAVILLLAGAFTFPGVASGGDDPELVFDDLGMLPRPTLECGGKDAIQQWQQERTLRSNERARTRGWAALHGIYTRLDATADPIAGALRRARFEAYDACLETERPLDLTCVAVARYDPALCALKDHQEFTRACQATTVAMRGALEGDHLRCADLKDPVLRRVCERRVLGRPDRSIGCAKDDLVCHFLTLLTVDVCRGGWPLLRMWPQLEESCRWVVLTDLIRIDPALTCDKVPGPVEPLCHSVLSRDPLDCATGTSRWGALVMARPCRNAQVLVPEVPLDQVAYGKGVVVTVPLLNPFDTVAACRVTVELSDGERTRFVATSEPFTLPAEFKDEAREFLTSKRFRMAPVDVGLTVSVTTDCAWAPGKTTGFRSDGVAVVD
jgi:hypothetical protein